MIQHLPLSFGSGGCFYTIRAAPPSGLQPGTVEEPRALQQALRCSSLAAAWEWRRKLLGGLWPATKVEELGGNLSCAFLQGFQAP